jgi:hypothetical protein
MAFRIQDFRSALSGDGARPNLFECNLIFPTFATSGGAGNTGGSADNLGVSQKFTFMARSAQLPGSSVNQVPVNYFGREIKFAGNRTFPEWTVTIINDEDFSIRNAFEKWLSGINSHVSNLRSAQFSNSLGYTTDGTITQYDKLGKRSKRYIFRGMFPIDVSPIEMDWGANDSIEEFSVTFAYQWWESDTTENAFRTA